MVAQTRLARPRVVMHQPRHIPRCAQRSPGLTTNTCRHHGPPPPLQPCGGARWPTMRWAVGVHGRLQQLCGGMHRCGRSCVWLVHGCGAHRAATIPCVRVDECAQRRARCDCAAADRCCIEGGAAPHTPQRQSCRALAIPTKYGMQRRCPLHAHSITLWCTTPNRRGGRHHAHTASWPTHKPCGA